MPLGLDSALLSMTSMNLLTDTSPGSGLVTDPRWSARVIGVAYVASGATLGTVQVGVTGTPYSIGAARVSSRVARGRSLGRNKEQKANNSTLAK
jgi:hypothetical protein